MGFSGTNKASTARPLTRGGYGYNPANDSHRGNAHDFGDEGARPPSSLMRSVYCVLGMPVDAVNMTTVVRRVDEAAARRTPFLLSTPNLNFLVGSLSDPELRESLLDSDLCTPDGAPIVWIARLLGLPIKERVAGADLLDELRERRQPAAQLRLFLFGGARGVAEAAATALNAQRGGLNCIGTMDPGFCEVDQMSKDPIINALNSSGADFLVLALGAKKGQSWLLRNHNRLTIPVRAHLGATINFQAGNLKRAPSIFRDWGLEWLWRIKEENYLWRRYRDDALVLVRLSFTRILPLLVISWLDRLRFRNGPLLIEKTQTDQSILLKLSGAASEEQILAAVSCFEDALAYGKDIVLDLTNVQLIDARFLGLLFMLRKELKKHGAKLTFAGLSRPAERIFRLNALGFLLHSYQAG